MLVACSPGQGLPPEPEATSPSISFTFATPPQESTFVSSGTVYYVAANDPDASDSNNGRYPTSQGGQDGPWLTIQYAADSMLAGDTTYVRSGTYYESGIVFASSGTPSAPIALLAYESEEVIIDGSQATNGLPGILIDRGQSHFLIEGFTIRDMPWSGIATDPETSQHYHDITIRDCLLYGNGWSGIDLAAVDGFLVESVLSHDNAYYGMNIAASEDGMLSSQNGAVRNASFFNHTGEQGHGLAINQGQDITVSDSVAYHNTIHGFDVSDWPKRGALSHHIMLERNLSYDNGVAGFSINSDSHHVVYHHNVAWRNGADWAGHGSASGFLCYEGCWHIEWYNNVSVDNSDAGFWVEDAWGTYSTPEDSLLVFHNNATYLNGRTEWGLERPALVILGVDWDVTATHNDWGGVPDLNSYVAGINVIGDDEGLIYTRDDINGGAFQVGNISLDPMFVDIKTADWRLRAGSPLIDAGTDVGLPFCGDGPDIGAIETCP